MIEISLVFGRRARRTSWGSTKPRPSTGRQVISQPVFSRCFTGVQYGVVLDARRDHVITRRGEAGNRQIVRLGASAGEDDF